MGGMSTQSEPRPADQAEPIFPFSSHLPDGSVVTLSGVVNRVWKRTTRARETMARFDLPWGSFLVPCMVYPKNAHRLEERLDSIDRAGARVRVTGTLDRHETHVEIIVGDVEIVDWLLHEED